MYEQLISRLKNLAAIEVVTQEPYGQAKIVTFSEEAVECIKEIANEAADALAKKEREKEQGMKRGKYEVLSLLSSAWHGKQYYFEQDDGAIYSRESGKYMPLDDAIEEFCNTLGDDGSI